MPTWFTAPVRVVVSGMIGGLVYWVLLRITGVNPLGLRWYSGVPASILLGGVAAFLAVYLLANSDTSAAGELKHTLAFALVCGIVWSPIIDTAKQAALSAIAAKKSDSVKDSAQALGATLANGSSASVQQQIANTLQSTTSAVRTLPSVTNDDVKRKVISDSQDAVGALVDASRKAPDASVDALFSIGKEAATDGDPKVLRSVLNGLQNVEAFSPEAASKAAIARQDIVRGISAQPPPQ